MADPHTGARPRTVGELSPAAMRSYERVRESLPLCGRHTSYTPGCATCQPSESLDTLMAILHGALTDAADLAAALAQVAALREAATRLCRLEDAKADADVVYRAGSELRAALASAEVPADPEATDA